MVKAALPVPAAKKQWAVKGFYPASHALCGRPEDRLMSAGMDFLMEHEALSQKFAALNYHLHGKVFVCELDEQERERRWKEIEADADGQELIRVLRQTHELDMKELMATLENLAVALVTPEREFNLITHNNSRASNEIKR